MERQPTWFTIWAGTLLQGFAIARHYVPLAAALDSVLTSRPFATDDPSTVLVETSAHRPEKQPCPQRVLLAEVCALALEAYGALYVGMGAVPALLEEEDASVLTYLQSRRRREKRLRQQRRLPRAARARQRDTTIQKALHTVHALLAGLAEVEHTASVPRIRAQLKQDLFAVMSRALTAYGPRALSDEAARYLIAALWQQYTIEPGAIPQIAERLRRRYRRNG